MVATYSRALQDASIRSFCFRIGSAAAAVLSPEPIVIVEGRTVYATPVAGTRGRKADPAEDAKVTQQLLNDRKEQMEHLISVLEEYRELQSVCEKGSVKVDQLADIHYYRTVQHLASLVSGTLLPTADIWDALRVLSPAITVSGVRKDLAIEAINRLESRARGLYAGSAGWVSVNAPHGRKDGDRAHSSRRLPAGWRGVGTGWCRHEQEERAAERVERNKPQDGDHSTDVVMKKSA